MVEFGVLSGGAHQIPDREGFQMLVLGNATGTASGVAGSDLKTCKIHKIDRDNLEDVLEELNISVHFEPLVPGGPASQLNITSLDDFHPDHIFDNLSAFESLRKLKRQLSGDHASKAIEEINSWGEQPSAEAQPPQEPNPTVLADDEITRENWFEHVLETSQDTLAAESGAVDWNQWVRDTIEPMQIATVDPNIDHYQSVVDKAIEVSMRRVLIHPVFKRCESFWRGMEFLVRRVDSDVDVKVSFLNCDVNQIVADVNSEADLSTGSLYHRIVRQTVDTPGAKAWSLVAFAQPFDLTASHVQAIGRIGKIISAAGSAAMVTAHFGDPAWTDDADLQEAWTELMKLDTSDSVSALCPRFLLRLPYGKRGGHVDRFRFEEADESINHLWGSPIWLAGSMLIRCFEQSGSVNTTNVFTTEGLPMHEHSNPELGDAYVSGEMLFSETELVQWIERGITPLVSFKDSDRISINGFQTISRRPWRV